MSKKVSIGFIGVGVMGHPIGKHLMAHGYDLLVFDVSDVAVNAMVKEGAKAAQSTLDVANQVDIIFTSLPSPAVFTDVMVGESGIVAGQKAKTVVDLSTVGSRAMKHAAAGLLAKGIDLVDAPVSGGPAGARAGTLSIMVAGKTQSVEKVQALLECFGKLFIVGADPGQAQLLKLLNNMLSSTAFAITSEAFVAGVKGGLDPQIMMNAINAGSGRSSASQDKFMKQVLPGTFDFGFPVGSVCKDIGLAVEECEALGVPMWIGNTVRQVWNHAGKHDGMKRDMTELVKSIERWSQLAKK